MSSNNFTSTFFFRHLEIFVIAGLVLLYLVPEIIILCSVIIFIIIIVQKVVIPSGIKNKTIVYNEHNISDDIMDYYHDKDTDIRIETKEIYIAFCPECGSEQKSYNTNFFCENCETKFVLEENTEIDEFFVEKVVVTKVEVEE